MYLVNFSQRAAAEQAQTLISANVTTREEREALREALTGARFDSPFGKDMQPPALRTASGCTTPGCCRSTGCSVEKLAQAGTASR